MWGSCSHPLQSLHQTRPSSAAPVSMSNLRVIFENTHSARYRRERATETARALVRAVRDELGSTMAAQQTATTSKPPRDSSSASSPVRPRLCVLACANPAGLEQRNSRSPLADEADRMRARSELPKRLGISA